MFQVFCCSSSCRDELFSGFLGSQRSMAGWPKHKYEASPLVQSVVGFQGGLDFLSIQSWLSCAQSVPTDESRCLCCCVSWPCIDLQVPVTLPYHNLYDCIRRVVVHGHYYVISVIA